ncbi:alpha/beta fold hydrolase [Kribbella speibonae]|uniref:Alpha/beta fold hydrolase n=1 Tax=Kribbella speibonae TaxID=1572660 RepID=A0ABY2ADE1_9ACTN|nr:alpha/beta fold hydrolase [Kribbella speibonae]TCC26852.1 alpha/beta fold hydrolase [Kribbella speibonae]
MTSFQTVSAGGLEVFYREAGKPGAPKLLLLGGFPSSSHQFRNLMPELDGRFHLVSIDYPGFGNTETPDPTKWEYTFDHLAEIVDEVLLGIDFTGPMGLYMHGHGGPIGNRLISLHPDWLQWQVIQNSNMYDEGFTEIWDGMRQALWTDRDVENQAPLNALLEPKAVKAIYLTGHPDPTKISPDNWNLALHFLARPNARRAQLDLFFDYRTNAAQYPAWQRRLRRDQPRTLIFWGQGDILFTPAGGDAYLRDLPDAQLVRLNSGHFATEDRLHEIVDGINSFYDETVK